MAGAQDSINVKVSTFKLSFFIYIHTVPAAPVRILTKWPHIFIIGRLGDFFSKWENPVWTWAVGTVCVYLCICVFVYVCMSVCVYSTSSSSSDFD